MAESTNFPFLITITIFTVWLSAVTFLLWKIYTTFKRLTKGASDKDLRALLGEILDNLKKGEKNDADLEQKCALLKDENRNNVQKVGLVRYNPFSETGGNQSFVLALLDGDDNGLVITSLHSRESTRVFAKPVTAGKETDFEFSKEEIQAILEAQRKRKSKLPKS